MGKVFWNGGTLLAPVPPALVTCGNMEKANVLTIGWTGIINTRPPMTYISVRPTRYSYEIIKKSGEFVINLPSENMCKAVDFCGVRSGKDVDKFKTCGLHIVEAKNVLAPVIEESPLSLECKVIETKSFGTHDMFIAEIVGIDADEKFIDKNGKLDLHKAQLLAYVHGEYFSLGKSLGTFGYSVKKKPKKKKTYKPKEK